MEQRKFGKNNLETSRIGLGLAALGRPGYINLGHSEDLEEQYNEQLMQKRACDMFRLAYELGIRYFDAARSYGKAEQFLHAWEKAPDDISIGSKWGYTYTADWKVEAHQHEVKEHSLNVLNRQWEETQHTLGRKPTIYHIHSASPSSAVLDNNEVLDRLWELKEGGTIVGLSLSGPEQPETLEKSFDIKIGTTQLFGSVQATWNMLEQSATKALVKARKLGYGIIVKEVLANGRLTLRNMDDDFSQKMHTLRNVAHIHQTGIDTVAMAYVLAQPWADIVLSGAANPAHLKSNLKAPSVKLDKDDMQAMDELVEDPTEYWNYRSELKWN